MGLCLLPYPILLILLKLLSDVFHVMLLPNMIASCGAVFQVPVGTKVHPAIDVG